MTLRWKIALAFTGTAAVVLAVLGGYLDAKTAESTTANVRSDLLAEVRLAALALPAPPWGSDAKLQELFHDLDARSDARVTLIGASGEVIALSPSTFSRPRRLMAPPRTCPTSAASAGSRRGSAAATSVCRARPPRSR